MQRWERGMEWSSGRILGVGNPEFESNSGARTASVDLRMMLHKRLLTVMGRGCVAVILEPLLSSSARAHFPISVYIYKLRMVSSYGT